MARQAHCLLRRLYGSRVACRSPSSLSSAGIAAANDDRDKTRFKSSLEKLIKGFVESMKPTAAVPYLGAGNAAPLDRDCEPEKVAPGNVQEVPSTHDE